MRIPLRMSLLFGATAVASSLFAQIQNATPIPSSTEAVSRPVDASQSQAQQSGRRDQLMLDIWRSVGQEHPDDVKVQASELLQLEPANSLALVTLAAAKWHARADDPEALGLAKRALRSVSELQRPQRMDDNEYERMGRKVRVLANRVAGDVYLRRYDFVSARRYLKESVALAPNDGSAAYSAALAYLDGKNADASTGYWLLARAVNLTANSEYGPAIATYAEQRYKDDGGTRDNWNRFLSSAAIPAPPIDRTTPTVVARQAPPPTPRVEIPAVSPPNQTPVGASQSAATVAQRPNVEQSAAAVAQPPAIEPKQSPAAGPAEKSSGTVLMASARTPAHIREHVPPPKLPLTTDTRSPDLEPIPERKLPVFRTGAPVSLGIVIQASIASKQSRSSVIYTLSDMVRGLGESDEAFIESYSDKISFAQDLTWNYDLLEQAMDQISSEGGTPALLDAVSFAANHLHRIAKNDNKVLLVISDGSESGTHSFSDFAVSQIRNSGARIVCIGIGVSDTASRDRLHELANITGGQAMFVAGPGDFRSAAHQIASSLGVHFQE